MKTKPDTMITNTPKPNQEEIQAWLDSVHFGSCCSDLVDNEDNNRCKLEQEDKQN